MITLRQAAGLTGQQRAAAMGQVEAALRRDKRNFDALMSGAAILYASGKRPPAVDFLRRAHAVRKNDVAVLQWLAVANSEIRDHKQAAACSAKLVKAGPDNDKNWEIRAKTLDAAGDAAGALAAFTRQSEIAGKTAELEFQMAMCRSYLGEMDEAAEGFLQTTDMEPTHAMALYGYATVHKFAPEEIDDYIARVDRAIPANRTMPDYNISALHYGAAKAYEDAGRNDEAFERYRQANEYRKPDSTDNLARPFENQKAAFGERLFAERADWGDRSAMPVFIVGLPRSGTTLVESIAAAHSAVSSGGEMPFIDDIAMNLGAETLPAQEYAARIAGLNRKEIGDLARKYTGDGRAMAGTKGRFTDKMPHNFMHVGLIFLLFPKAKIIHCLRHPVDNCVSIYTNAMTPAHNYYKSDLATLGRYYRLYDDLMDYWEALFPEKLLQIRYEDMVADTERNARRIIEFLNLPWQDKVLDRAGSAKSVKTLSAWQVRQPIYTTSAGKWRKFERHLGPLLETLGPAVGEYDKQPAAPEAAAALAGTVSAVIRLSLK